MLALIAGQGGLPKVVSQTLGKQPHLIYALEGFTPEGMSAQSFRIEHLGSLIAELRNRGVAQVCFIGRIARPHIDPKAIDAATMPLVPRMMEALNAADDAALRTVIDIFEEAGLATVGAHDLCPDLVLPEGVIYGAPGPQDEADLARAQAVHRAMAQVDVGQAVVVAKGQVLAVEALPGTDWMLRSLKSPVEPMENVTKIQNDPGDPFEFAFGAAADWLSGTDAPAPIGRVSDDFARPPGGLLYKAPKANQDLRIDLPVIGPETMRGAALAGLNGIVVEAGGVMVLEQDATRQIAKQTGLFLWSVPAP